MKIGSRLTGILLLLLGSFALAQDNGTWKDVVDAKIAARNALIPTEYLVPEEDLPSDDVLDVSDFPYTSGFFTDKELEITDSTASDVVFKIKCGNWTATEVLEATIKRAVVAHQLVNPLSEVVFERGRGTAKKLDEHFAKTGKTVGPLHGLPISLKDQWRFKGLDATIGYVSWANHPAAEDSLGVTTLESLGAVLYTKTNVPTALMAGETENNIFNTTMNPFNRRLAPGGSSGGESALVAFKGSFIGFGTDIGGSIRIPSTNGGLYALRPSIGRCTYQNMANSLRGEEGVTSACGPMGRSAADIQLVMSSLVNAGTWKQDPQVVPIPWREEEEKLPKKLSFGWANGDEWVRPWPPLQRAMREVKDKLEKMGHEVVEWTPPGWAAANQVYGSSTGLFHLDAHQDIQTAVNASGEPYPSVIASYLTWVPPENRSSVYEAWNMVADLRNYTDYYRKQWLLTTNLTSTGRPFDGLIMPATSFVAKERGSSYPYGYQNLSPFLDLATGVFPVTRVNSSIDVVNETFVPLTDKDAANQALYDDPTRWENAPVGLQVIGQRLEEEKMVSLLGVISKALGHSR